MRRSGEPYISHPIAVAEICADWKLDTQSITAEVNFTKILIAASVVNIYNALFDANGLSQISQLVQDRNQNYVVEFQTETECYFFCYTPNAFKTLALCTSWLVILTPCHIMVILNFC